MNDLRKSAFFIVAPMVWTMASACGGEALAPIAAELVAPEARQSTITLTPALEVSAFDEGLLQRIVIEDIHLNLGDVRLLGADPSIPAGGLGLLEQDVIVEAMGDDTSIDLPFPSQFLDDEDLAVYVRIDRSPNLDGASVVVRARLYKNSIKGGATSLLAETTSATDPDGDPAKESSDGRTEATDPDGDPAHPTSCHDLTDPDSNPTQPACRKDSLVQRGEFQPYVTVELRDNRAADLVATLTNANGTDVVVGIPVSRWLTREVLEALDAQIEDNTELGRSGSDPRDTIVVQTHDALRDPSRGQVADCPNDDYFLSDDKNLERLTVRR